MGNISANFDYEEFEKTNHEDLASQNKIPNDEVRENIKALVDNILQPLRDEVGVPVIINSGYRCEELNKRVGGAENSQHRRGQAADIRTNAFNPYNVAKFIQDKVHHYDQMILYNTFVHVSYNKDGEQRDQLLYNKEYTGDKL